jgi:predicted nucleotidyltransferase
MSDNSALPAQRKPKDRDFIETKEGLLFCVVGYLHPPDKYTAYLKYSPATAGRWQRQGRAYRRELAFYHAHQVAETLDILQTHYPHYVHTCPVRDMRFSMVPQEYVQTYYCPEQRLAEILAHPADPLEETVVKVVQTIQEATGLSSASLGVTGSILLGIHDPGFSDIDLTVYGRENVRRLRPALAAGLPGTAPPDKAYMEDWRRGVMRYFGLSEAQARWLVSRRWTFTFPYPHRAQEGVIVSLHPTRTDAEIQEVYGEHIYRDVGMVRLQATIADAAEAVFMPAIYALTDVHILEGPAVAVSEICAYEGLFSQVADVGERVEARGKLEQVDGGRRYRLVIGSSRRAGPEYLLPIGLL